jgi:transcriptional regulator with GAF, ATPase, and Fis domain
MTEMDADRLARVGRRFAGARDPAQSLCATSAAIIGVAGAGLVLMSDGQALGSLCVSDARTAEVEDVQYTLGEGPCLDAFRSQAPVLVPDLEGLDPSRWTGFRVGALQAGVQAAFGFPLLVGATCIGALDLYHDRIGALTDEQFADAEAVAYVASRTVLGWQAVAEQGSLAWQLEQVPLHRAVIHQAAGMVSVQASVAVEDALALLRAVAFADGQPVSTIAADIVAGQRRIEA